MRRFRLFIILLIINGLLVFAHIFLRKQLGFFNLDKEGSLKAVYSGFQLLVTAGAAACIAYLVQEKTRWLWGFVSAVFFYLGLDEMMVIHERIGFVVNRWTALTGYWGESFNWLLYFSPAIAVSLIAYFFLFRVVWKEDRIVAVGVLLGTFFFAASVVLEMVGGMWLGSALYQTLVILEESAQLIGESLFLVTFLHFLQKKFNHYYTLRI